MGSSIWRFCKSWILLPTGHVLAMVIRGAVRCTSPLVVLGLFVGLLNVGQGQDAVRIVLENAVSPQRMPPEAVSIVARGSVDGLLFLLVATLALSLSIWYSMRWLLGVELKGLPMPETLGGWRRWLPRLLGAAPLVAVGLACWTVNGEAPLRSVALRASAACFLMAMAFVLFCRFRRSWLDRLSGRHAKTDGVSKGRTALADSEPIPHEAVAAMVWSISLSLLMAVLLFAYQQTLSRVLGSAAITALALASINLFGSFVLSLWPLRKGLPPMGPVLIAVAGLALGHFNDNHVIQPVSHEWQPQAWVPWGEKHDWPLSQLTEEEKRVAAPRTEVPPVIEGMAQGMRPLFIASEGGGIRAAFWTAAVLEALDSAWRKQATANKPALHKPWTEHLYAMSGVSGGSLGVTAWLLSNRAKWCESLPPASQDHAAWVGPPKGATDLLAVDFLAPAVQGLLYQDLVQRLMMVPIAAFDRSRGLEDGWQRAFASLPGQPMSRTLHDLYAQCPRLPRLILNATAVETGRHAPLTLLPNPLFTNAEDVMQGRTDVAGQALAGLVHHSARFPLLSPAGTVALVRAAPGEPPETVSSPVPWRRLVDGGYFDNSGVYALLDLVQRPPFGPGEPGTGEAKGPQPARPRPLLLLIRNDPSPLRRCAQERLAKQRSDVSPSSIFPEIGSIILGLYQARSAHAASAREAACLNREIDTIDISVSSDPDWENVPLGWALSGASMQKLRDEATVAVARAMPALIRHLSGHLSGQAHDLQAQEATP